VARVARTSTPAVYELFGDKRVWFAVRRYLDRLDESGDPRRDLVQLAAIYRRFLRDHPPWRT
jgi:AcrR family transcriptional regulator